MGEEKSKLQSSLVPSKVGRFSINLQTGKRMLNCAHTVIATPENNCESITTTGEKHNKMLKTSFPRCGNTDKF